MKKVFLIGFILCCLLSITTVFASDNVEVYLNGNPLNFDVAPRVIDWRTVVPMRTIFEALGADVEVSLRDKYLAFGWGETANDLQTTMYTLEGKTKTVFKDNIEAYKKLGWYTEPVYTMYAPDGRNIVIEKTEIEAYMNDGWYFTKEAADKANTAQPSHQHNWVPITVHHDEIGYYIRTYGKQITIICQGCFRAFLTRTILKHTCILTKKMGVNRVGL